jgi:hypothetical protein
MGETPDMVVDTRAETKMTADTGDPTGVYRRISG